jgi:hypothetical protein
MLPFVALAVAVSLVQALPQADPAPVFIRGVQYTTSADPRKSGNLKGKLKYYVRELPQLLF